MAPSSDDSDDVTRRTLLAAERTWLAWWRSAVAAAAAAVAVGGVVPELVNGGRVLYSILGSGYAVLAAAMFVAAGLRQRRIEGELARGERTVLDVRWVAAFSIAGTVLALGTLAAVVAAA